MKYATIIIILISVLLSANSCTTKTSEEDKNEQIIYPLVNLETVTRQDFKHEIVVQGNIETDKDVLLTAEMGGLLTAILVKDGQHINKGQVIATIDAAVLSSNVAELESQLEYAQYMLSKQEELNERGVGSEFDLKAAKNQVNALKSKMNSLNTQKGKASIRAPFSGIVDNVFARKGQMASPQSPLIRLVNNKSVDIVATLSEKHIANIKVGTPIKVSFPNYMDTSINLAVTNVGNYIEPVNRTFRIMSAINNNSFLIPNMLAEVSIVDFQRKDAIVISSKSIFKDQDNMDYVFVAKKSGENYVVEKVNVIVLNKFHGTSLIKEDNAINAMDLVVTEGARGIAVGDTVRSK